MGCTGFHGPSPLRGLRDVALRAGHAAVDERLARLRVADHDDPGALPVAAARREAGVVEDALEDLVGQWLVGELGGPHRWCA